MLDGYRGLQSSRQEYHQERLVGGLKLSVGRLTLFFSYQNEDQSTNMQCQGGLDDWKAKHVLAVMDCVSLS